MTMGILLEQQGLRLLSLETEQGCGGEAGWTVACEVPVARCLGQRMCSLLSREMDQRQRCGGGPGVPALGETTPVLEKAKP